MIAHTEDKDISKTRQTRVLNIISILAIGALFLVLLLHFRQRSQVTITKPTYDAILTAGDLSIPITIADTPQEQEQGLSGTASLDKNAGKLFVFKTEGDYGFWMQDMAYSLDIIWIDSTFHIVGITSDIGPETYPKVFYPPTNVQYVLEVNAGFSTAHNLAPNQLLTLTNILSF